MGGFFLCGMINSKKTYSVAVVAMSVVVVVVLTLRTG